MKTLTSILAVALALAFTVPAFAGGGYSTKKTEAECTAAGGIWDPETNRCLPPREPVR